MGKYTKILIGAILLSLANKILLGNLMFISFVEIGLIIYALYWISHLSVLEIDIIEDIPKPAMKIFSAI